MADDNQRVEPATPIPPVKDNLKARENGIGNNPKNGGNPNWPEGTPPSKTPPIVKTPPLKGSISEGVGKRLDIYGSIPPEVWLVFGVAAVIVAIAAAAIIAETVVVLEVLSGIFAAGRALLASAAALLPILQAKPAFGAEVRGTVVDLGDDKTATISKTNDGTRIIETDSPLDLRDTPLLSNIKSTLIINPDGTVQYDNSSVTRTIVRTPTEEYQLILTSALDIVLNAVGKLTPEQVLQRNQWMKERLNENGDAILLKEGDLIDLPDGVSGSTGSSGHVEVTKDGIKVDTNAWNTGSSNRSISTITTRLAKEAGPSTGSKDGPVGFKNPDNGGQTTTQSNDIPTGQAKVGGGSLYPDGVDPLYFTHYLEKLAKEAKGSWKAYARYLQAREKYGPKAVLEQRNQQEPPPGTPAFVPPPGDSPQTNQLITPQDVDLQFYNGPTGYNSQAGAFTIGVTAVPQFPLLLDLGNNGIETISYADSKAYFDFTGAGFAQKTSWVSKNDATLAIDFNQNGIIDDVYEQFGFNTNGGFDELRNLDSNQDNVIDASDEAFSLLRVWQDANEDGTTDVGELKTMSEASIQSISLTTRAENFIDHENDVFESAVFTKTDGSTSRVYDVALKASPTITQSKGDYVIDPSIANFPWVRGYGLTKDLLVAASENAELKGKLLTAYVQPNAYSMYSQMDELIASWMGSGAIGQNTPGEVDPAKVVILRQYLNIDVTDLAGKSNYVSIVDDTYYRLKHKIFVDFISQTPVGKTLGVYYDFVQDTYQVDPNSFYDQLIENLSDTKFSFTSYFLAEVLNDAGTLDSSLLADAIYRHGFGEFLVGFLQSKYTFTPEQGGPLAGDAQDNILYSTNTNVSGVSIQGNDGNDVLVSTAGNDTLAGGNGNDVYIIDLQSGQDVIQELSGLDRLIVGAGITKENLVFTRSGNNLLLWFRGNQIALLQNYYTTGTIETLSFKDGSFLTSAEILSMNATVSGAGGNDVVNGNNFANLLSGSAGNDTLNGGAGDDTLDGGSGADSMVGGSGNDLYMADSSSDVIVENFLEGVDTVQASVSYTLSENIEDLILTGSGNINATGNESDNTLTANSGANTLSGLGGNDTYILDANTDLIVEDADAGFDTIEIGASYTLGANLENLTLTGTAALIGQGNSLENTLTGNNAASTLLGGAGNDTYIVQNSATVITEAANEGTDSVQSSVQYTLSSNVENLTLTGINALSGQGNSLDNMLTGNDAASTLIGGAGNDTYIVQNSATVLVEAAGSGNDTVYSSISFALNAEIEALNLTGIDDLSGTGNALNNTITGNAGQNTLDGGLGVDTLVGGIGNDLYIVDNAGDVVTENTNEGTDTVQSSVSYTLSSNVENLTLTGASALTGVGNSLDNVISANSAASTLSGGLGNDTYIVQNSATVITENINEGTDSVQTSISYTLSANVENLTLTGASALTGVGNSLENVLSANNAASTLSGGLGNDMYIVQNSATIVQENASEGTDSIQASISYTLSANVENLTLTDTNALTGVGNSLNNKITGNSANNLLDGATGADTLSGGAGNDAYIVDNAGDIIEENASEGMDSVQSSVSYTLANYVENLTLSGSSAISGTGNSYHNYITGNNAANTLKGQDGNDTLDGAQGADTLVGGVGDDIYLVESAGDVVVEAINEGIDTVQSGINWTLSNQVENLTLTGNTALLGVGNSLDNVLAGNSAVDTLSGGLGNDIYLLQNAATVVVENASEGIDTVEIASSYTLSTHLENLTLTGTAALVGTGNASNNILTGNKGADTLTGGLGDDVYIISNSNTTIVEGSNEGIDTIQAFDSYSISANVENLILVGTHDSNVTGNNLNNQITGNDQANLLDGGTGADTLTGGDGNDSYVVDNAGDVVIEEAARGTDTVLASISYTLSTYLENLTLTSANAIDGTGNEFHNMLIGNANKNKLVGLAGNDTLDGGFGIDTLIGGTGNDIYLVDNSQDVVTENFDEGVDTVQSTSNYSLTSNTENLTLLGTQNVTGTGNTLGNILIGNTGNNKLMGLEGDDILDGLQGADTLIGGQGNDLYLVDNASDQVQENANEGQDLVQSSISITLGANVEALKLTGLDNNQAEGNSLDNILAGNAGNNLLVGLAGNDVLDGNIGMDTMQGGTGSDTYWVDNSGDVVTENANEGIDLVNSTVSYTLSANVENLTLTGSLEANATGNTLSNLLIGNGSRNILNGISGADTMIGGAGDDDYFVNSADDIVVENTNEGVDLVEASIDYTLTQNTEFLVLAEAAGNISGYGNSLDNTFLGNTGNNLLSGYAGNDTLDGDAGTDTLVGGTGNDWYLVDNANDLVLENANEGTDIIQSSVSFTLSSNVEKLLLTGSSNLTATGNSLDNVLIGNEGNSTLTGGIGNDWYVLQNTTTVITENAAEGTDTVQTDLSYTLGTNLENLVLTGTQDSTATGNSANNQLTGNTGHNTLDGGTGADTLVGGLGNDLYMVDNAGDVVTENANEGTDTIQSSVSYTLSANVENLTLTGASALSGVGNSLDNTLTGNAAASTLAGGLGNDIYVVQTGSTVITELANEGTDTLQSSVSYTLGANLENLTLTGSSNLTATGNSLNNVLSGNTGNSTLIGGLGNDTYVLQNSTTVITENATEGTDTVQSSVSYTLGANFENLTLTGSDAVNGTGNSVANVLTGNVGNNVLSALDGNDTLSGGGGQDTLVGGLGNDVYLINNSGVTITENTAEGTDTVQASISYTLDANVENLTLTGTADLSGTGNTLNNTLTGNTGHNTLDGGAGADTLIGGQGNDLYVVDNTGDVVTENASEGTDTVQSSINYTLGANVENLTLSGSANLTATGNTGANILTGNAGNSTLTGGLGNDIYVLQNSTTVIVENASEGTDTVQTGVSYTLGSNLENLTLTGSAAITGTGNALDNVLTGSNVSSTLAGGLGNDTYVVLSPDNVIVENASEGTDTVQAGVHYTLSANLENLTLTGTANLNGTGNTGNNVLTGNTGINTLVGLDGNDTLNGGAGADFLYGGLGNDTYIVDSTGDLVVENASEGTDTIQASVSYTLSANVENLTLTGTSGISGTGNSLNNAITGNIGNNLLDGGAGADTLAGGQGNDTYVVDNAGDVVTENASEGTDTVQSSITYTLGANVENLTLMGSGNLSATGNTLDNVLTGNTGNSTLIGGTGNDIYILQNTTTVITENASAGTDTVKIGSSYTLGANLENLTLTGTGNITGSGNSSANVITGTNGNNTLDGGAGADTLIGAQGNDTYIVDNSSDVITENASEGIDLVLARATYTLSSFLENLTLTGASNINGTGNTYGNVITGNTGNNLLIGGAGDDTLDGGTGTDTLVGGTGDDLFIVTSASQVLTENGQEGTDTVQTNISYTLATYFENLRLTGSSDISGTGTSYDNVLTGNSGKNTITGLTGNDTLDGGQGADTLIGGAGDDTYLVDNVGDVVTENANDGTDTIQSTIDYVLGNNIENLQLIGNSNNGTGNASDNLLVGNTANNRLDGGLGEDTLMGGLGNDTYLVDSQGDIVIEKSGEGSDSVQSAVDYSLSANLENLTLIESAALAGLGNELDNILTGNTKNNTLYGNAGNDTLDGGTGADTLVGGQGNDVYTVDRMDDLVVELSGEGTDTVKSNVTYALSAQVENLILTGTASIDGTGNDLDNIITGNSGNNVLSGGAGNDTYKMGNASGSDTISDASGIDTLDFSDSTSSVTIDLSQNTAALPYSPAASSQQTLFNLNSQADGSTTIPDYFGNAWTVTGNAAVGSSNPWKAGEKLITFDGNGDSIKTTAVVPTGNNWTLRWRQRFDLFSGYQTLLSANRNSTLRLLFSGVNLSVNISGNGSSYNIVLDQNASKTNWVANQWYEFEFSYSNTGGYKIFVDGQQVWQTTNTTALYNTNGLVFGAENTLENPAKGAMSDMYFTNQETLHSSNFTPLTGSYASQFPTNYLSWSTNSIENMVGSSGNDALTGTTGDNVLTGGAGNDTLTGGAGNDAYRFASGFGTDTINDASGTDTLDFSSFTAGVSVSLANTSFTESAGNTVSWSANALENLSTGSGNDSLTGNASANVLNGGAGNDTLTGGAGNDTLIGGAGNDTYAFATGFGTDNIQGSDGVNILDLSSFTSNLTVNLTGTSFTESAGNTVSWASNTLQGAKTGSGNDILIGNTGDNLLLGGAGNDSLNAGDGNDTLVGEAGNDTLDGGLGNDLYQFTGTFGADSIVDAGGTDTLDLAGLTSNMSLSLANTSFTASTGNTITWAANALENVLAGSGNDTITGSAGDNVLSGGAGNDSVDGGAGNDIYQFKAGFGTDTITDASGNDTVDFSALSSNLTVNLSATSMTESTGHVVNWTANALENAIAGAGHDTLVGTSGDNRLTGGAGNDTLTGGAGNDTLNGGDGDDTYVFASGFGTDVIQETGGADTLDFSQLTQDVLFSLLNTAYQTSPGHVVSWTSGDIENVSSGSGNDSLEGSAGNNLLSAGSGNDTLVGGAGLDTLVGGAGNDVYVFSDGFGVDQITETSGTDIIDFGLITASVNLDLAQSTYNDGNGNLLIWTPGQVENLTTGSGNDVLTGDTQNNVLTGGSGNDTLIGNAGSDLLKGGAGNDLYIFRPGSGSDTIDDSSGNDTIDLSAYSGNLTVDLNATSVNVPLGMSGTSNQFSAFSLNAQADGSTTIPDYFGNAWTVTGNAAVGSSSPWKAGEKLITFDGNGDSIKTTAVVPTGNNWTLRWRQRFDQFSGYQTLLSANRNNTLRLLFSGVYLAVNISGNGSSYNVVLDQNTSKTNWVANQWYEFEFSYSNTGGYKIFVDGQQVWQTTSTTPIYNTNGLVFGAENTLENPTRGAMSDMYFTNQETLHSGNFTPLTTSYLDSLKDVISWNAGALENVITGSGNDVLTGTSADNQLTGGSGNDSLIGGAGNDTYKFAPGFGTDTINDASGTDTMDFSAFATGLTVDLSSTSFTESTGNSVTWGAGSIENLITGAGSDVLTGNASANLLNAGNGNNTIIGGVGNDTLIGGLDSDVYQFANGFGVDSLSDAEGFDTLDFSALTDALSYNATTGQATASTSSVTWNTANTTIEKVLGGSGNDSMLGSSGDDYFNGGAGNDTLNGGAGNDTYLFSNSYGTDSLSDTSGTDTLDFSAITTALIYNASAGTATAGSNAASWNAASSFFENVIGGSGNDSLTGGTGNETMQGGLGNDSLIGGAGNDLLQGGMGSDLYTLQVGDGLDIIQDSDPTPGNLDTVLFENSVTVSKIAFFKSNQDLQIGFVDSAGDLITVQDQWQEDNTVERFQLADGRFMTDADMNQLIADMSAYAAEHNINMNSLSDVKNSQDLMNLVAAGWHS